LIALIINVHTLGRMLAARTPKTEVKRRYAAGSLIRKTSLLRKIEPVMRRSSFTNKDRPRNPLTSVTTTFVLEIVFKPRE